MTTPEPSISATWEPAPPAARDRSAAWPVLTVLFAVLSAVLAVLLFRADGAQPLTTSADAALTPACAVLDEVDPEATEMGGFYQGNGFVTFHQLSLVSGLAWVAFAYDESYEEARDSLIGPVEAVAQNPSAESGEFQEAIGKAQQTCGERAQD